MAPWLSTRNFPRNEENKEVNVEPKVEKDTSESSWKEITRENDLPKGISKKVAALLESSDPVHRIKIGKSFEVSIEKIYEEEWLIFWLSESESTHFLLHRKSGLPVWRGGDLLWSDSNLPNSNIVTLPNGKRICFIASWVGTGSSYFDFRKYILIDTEGYKEIKKSEFTPERDSQAWKKLQEIEEKNSIWVEEQDKILAQIEEKKLELRDLQTRHRNFLKYLTPRELAAQKSQPSILDITEDEYTQPLQDKLQQQQVQILSYELATWDRIIVEIVEPYDENNQDSIQIHLVD